MKHRHIIQFQGVNNGQLIIEEDACNNIVVRCRGIRPLVVLEDPHIRGLYASEGQITIDTE